MRMKASMQTPLGFLLAFSIVFFVFGVHDVLSAAESAPLRRSDSPYMLNYTRFIQYGWYLSVKSSAANYSGGWGALFGGRAAFVIDRIFAVGAGYEISLHATRGSLNGRRDGSEWHHLVPGLAISRPKLLYGGGHITYHIIAEMPVNFSLGALAGWGHLGRNYASGGSRFFVLEPEIFIYANMPRHVRVGAGASYRFTWGVQCQGINDRDIRGFSVGIQIQAGLIP